MARRCFIWVLSLALTTVTGLAGSKYDSRIARLSLIEGHVSFQHSQDVEWSAASINMALQPSDRLYTGEDGRAEIQFDDGSVLRLAEKTDVEILSLREDFIQLRILVGLSTLTVQSSIGFEINTPAAAFNTIRNGVYRFDVQENGDTDAIVRKGLLDAANNHFSRRIESGELLHVIPEEKGTPALSRYDTRDEWDEWNDRRNADLMAYESRKYLPSYANIGVRELDRYGRWMVAEEYGPAWVPTYITPGWSPYWQGRWCYRPFWGWTWVSYEPWGWLPYHYGRWHFSINLGWCWIPGASFGFHFWSPGLVRFYHGPGWVSWCPLGPRDYYNVNNYFYNTTYAYQLNDLRLLQRRGPEDLANRNVPGAFRTAGIEQFRNGSFGPERHGLTTEAVGRPWISGRLLTGQPNVEPTSRSYSPLPERQGTPPSLRLERPVVVRTEPGVEDGLRNRFSRITNPSIAPIPRIRPPENAAEQESRDSAGFSRSGETGREGSRGNWGREGQRFEDSGSRPGIWNRSPQGSPGALGSRPNYAPSRPQEAVPPSSSPNRNGRSAPGPRQPTMDKPGYEPRSRSDHPPARPSESPSAPTNRYDRQPVNTPRQPERPATEPRPRPSEPSAPAASFTPRSSGPTYSPWQSSRIDRSPQLGGWAPARSNSPQWRSETPGRTYGGGYSSPSARAGGSFGGPPGAGLQPSVRAPQGDRSGGNPINQRRRGN